MIEFVEKLAPIQQVGVVSCRTDVMPMYKGLFYCKLISNFKDIDFKFEDTLVNSRNKKYIFRNLGRGYHAVREDPIVDHIPRETLTRTELKYVIMIRNKRNLPLPNEILRSKSGSGVHT